VSSLHGFTLCVDLSPDGEAERGMKHRPVSIRCAQPRACHTSTLYLMQRVVLQTYFDRLMSISRGGPEQGTDQDNDQASNSENAP
jgi:hypothetical protein